MQNQKTIIWDWNGTLLNDIKICIDAINLLLRKRNKAGIDIKTYKDIFTFPVKDYYVSAGFDFTEEPFEKPALEFIQEYEELVRDASLHDDAVETLDHFEKQGFRQMILSAMHKDFLLRLVRGHSIERYFSHISGIDDHYAAGKIENGKELLNGINGNANKVIMVGDTIHDHEVASALGIDVILVANGHQSEERLKSTGCQVVHKLKDLKEII